LSGLRTFKDVNLYVNLLANQVIHYTLVIDYCHIRRSIERCSMSRQSKAKPKRILPQRSIPDSNSPSPYIPFSLVLLPPSFIHYPPPRYQDPSEADKISKIQKDLEATTEILHKTIDSVLERGVKLDSLVDRSDDLSRQSKMFYKQAKKTNSCCTIS
jgi:hypothetical protein